MVPAAGVSTSTTSNCGSGSRLVVENAELQDANERLEDLLEEVGSEKDYLQQAHEVTLSSQQKLIEARTGRSGLDRLLPWRSGHETG